MLVYKVQVFLKEGPSCVVLPFLSWLCVFHQKNTTSRLSMLVLQPHDFPETGHDAKNKSANCSVLLFRHGLLSGQDFFQIFLPLFLLEVMTERFLGRANLFSSTVREFCFVPFVETYIMMRCQITVAFLFKCLFLRN